MKLGKRTKGREKEREKTEVVAVAAALCWGPRNALSLSSILNGYIQCVSLDSTGVVIYPEIKATNVTFSVLKSLPL